jgi:CRP/FNR family transcriptional regulator, nitrogen oxide reductase regulator
MLRHRAEGEQRKPLCRFALRAPSPEETTLLDQRAERIHAAVGSSPMFRGLPAEDQRRIEAIATLRDLPKGEVVWNAGDPAETLTLIVSGRVKIVRHGAGGDVILEIFGRGEPLGAVAVYNRIPYPASAVTMEPTTLLCMPAADWFELLERHPDLSHGLIVELTRLNMSLARKLEEMRGQRIEVRIAQLFLGLADRSGRKSAEGLEIPIALSRQEVAELVGTTVETAIRTLSRWNREGLLVTGNKRFLVPSPEKLRAVAEGRAEG